MKLQQTDIFGKWLRKLRDAQARARIELRLRRIELTGNLGDYKTLGNKLCELRISFGPGYRIYFTSQDETIVLLLLGGDKSTQQRDIERARKILDELEEVNRNG